MLTFTPYAARSLLAIVVVAVSSGLGVWVLASSSTPGPEPYALKAATSRNDGVSLGHMTQARRVFAEKWGMDVVSGFDSSGNSCLAIGDSATTYCFDATEVAAGQAFDFLARCPRLGAGRRVIAGIAAADVTEVTLAFDKGPTLASPVVNRTYAFAMPLPKGAFRHPRTISWRAAGTLEKAIRYPVAEGEDPGCNRP